MIVNHSRHSKRSTVASIVILIVIGLIFFIVTGYAKEEKDEQQGDMISRPTADTSKTPPPANVDKGQIIIDMKQDGEIWVQGEKIDLASVKSMVEDFRNEHPDGNVVITCDKDDFKSTALKEILEQVRAGKVKDVVVAASIEK